MHYLFPLQWSLPSTSSCPFFLPYLSCTVLLRNSFCCPSACDWWQLRIACTTATPVNEIWSVYSVLDSNQFTNLYVPDRPQHICMWSFDSTELAMFRRLDNQYYETVPGNLGCNHDWQTEEGQELSEGQMDPADHGWPQSLKCWVCHQGWCPGTWKSSAISVCTIKMEEQCHQCVHHINDVLLCRLPLKLWLGSQERQCQVNTHCKSVVVYFSELLRVEFFVQIRDYTFKIRHGLSMWICKTLSKVIDNFVGWTSWTVRSWHVESELRLFVSRWWWFIYHCHAITVFSGCQEWLNRMSIHTHLVSNRCWEQLLLYSRYIFL